MQDTVQDNGYQTIIINNQIVVFGVIFKANTGISTSVLDTMGNLLSKRSFFHSNYHSYSIGKALKQNENSIYATGWVNNYLDTSAGVDLMFIKFDMEGDTVFTRIYHDTGSVAPIDIIPYYNNSFLLLNIYATDYSNVTYFQTGLTVIDTLGNILKTTYTQPSKYRPTCLVHDTLTKEIYALGDKEIPNPNGYSFENYLMCFEDTTLQTKFTIDNITNHQNGYLQAAGFYKGSVYFTFGTQNMQMIKMKVVNQTVSIKKQEVYAPTLADHIYTSNLIFDRENIIFFGYNSKIGSCLYFCDTTRIIARCKALVGPPDSVSRMSFGSISKTASNKISSTGLCYDFLPATSHGHWNFLSMNYREFIAGLCGIFLAVDEIDIDAPFSLYPNPATSQLNIQFKNGEFQKSVVEITDIQGRILYNYTLEEKLNIDISHYENGIYFFILRDKNQKKFTKKFIKH